MRETTREIPDVRLRDLFVLRDRDECTVVRERPHEGAYNEWRALCLRPPGAPDGVEAAILAEEF